LARGQSGQTSRKNHDSTGYQGGKRRRRVCLFIGQNRQGLWAVQDARRLCGGVFANRTEAIRFAMVECQRRPQSVIMLPDGLELDLALAVDREMSRAA
jgi:hypothetical protein